MQVSPGFVSTPYVRKAAAPSPPACLSFLEGRARPSPPPGSLPASSIPPQRRGRPLGPRSPGHHKPLPSRLRLQDAPLAAGNRPGPRRLRGPAPRRPRPRPRRPRPRARAWPRPRQPGAELQGGLPAAGRGGGWSESGLPLVGARRAGIVLRLVPGSRLLSGGWDFILWGLEK